MKKVVLFLLALAMVALTMTAYTEGVLTDQNIGESLEVGDSDGLLDTIPVVNQAVGVTEEVEDIDLDAEDEVEDDEDEDVEVEDIDLDAEDEVEDDEVDIIEEIDLDAGELLFPEVLCEVLEDTFELSEPREGAPIAGGHYKGELLPIVDVIGDYWLLQNGNYVSADAVQIYNEADIPGESEAKTVVNPRNPRKINLVLAPIASDIDDIAEQYHSVIIYAWSDQMLYCYKYGERTLEVRLSDATWISPVFPAWTITELFTEEGTGAVGVDGLMELIYQYSLPGSYLVIFP